MRRSFALAAAADTLLTILHALFPAHTTWLPLAGSDIAQLGVCLGIAAVIEEVLTAFKR